MELLDIKLLASVITIAGVITRYRVSRYGVRYKVTRYKVISQRNYYSRRNYYV